MSRLELWGRSGGALTGGVCRELETFGHEVAITDRPTGDVPWVDLALERSPDGIGPPIDAFPASPSGRSGVVVTSTLAYHPDERHIGMAPEGWGHAPPGSVADAWRRFEISAEKAGHTVLRAAPTPLRGGRDRFSRWLDARVAPTAFGFDPCLQLLHVEDLASAIDWGLGARPRGPVNVVPERPIFVRQAVREAGRLRVPVPTAILRRGRVGGAADHLRHPFTARGDRAARLGWKARFTSRQAAAAFAGREATVGEDDELGLDSRYVGRLERTLFRFLHDAYWRVEYRGVENLPSEGGAILVGVHRGFMPWDGVMMLVGCHRTTGRYVRFLIHPGLLKFPILAPYMNKLGGVVACRENADRLLEREWIVGVFPEGLRGAFRPYRDWHRVGRFDRYGRDEFVRMALRHRVPIVPFATVGSAEVFPIWGRIEWRWWRRFAEWPFIPVTTPLPLPSKWHTDVLPAIDPAAEHGPEAADDPEIVKRISRMVRDRLQGAIDGMRSKRRSIFFGTLFENEGSTRGAAR